MENQNFMRRKRGIRKTKWIWILAIIALTISIIYSSRYYLASWLNHEFSMNIQINARPLGMSEQDWCRHNYEEVFRTIAAEEGVNLQYLLALAVLECGGERPAGSRFEPHIYKKLLKLQSGKRNDFEGITPEDLEGVSDDDLRKLATSWGPFQLMGYQCISLGADVEEIVDGPEAFRLACKWMKKNYGNFLESERYRDAFHMHNTGSPFPANGKSQTHSKDYIPRGLRYMKYFDQKN